MQPVPNAMPTQKNETEQGEIASSFPSHLLEGYSNFCHSRLDGERKRYQKLADAGQEPQTMLVACCDSRSAPEVMFDAAPGEMFVVRNVANIVPPYKPTGHVHSTSAALEYAVEVLMVKNIVVMGHGRCGGIAAYRQQLEGEKGTPLTDGDFIGRWIELLEPVANQVDRTCARSPEELQRCLEEQAIINSLKNLRTFPDINGLVNNGTLALHGAWFDISNGELWILNQNEGVFHQHHPKVL